MDLNKNHRGQKSPPGSTGIENKGGVQQDMLLLVCRGCQGGGMGQGGCPPSISCQFFCLSPPPSPLRWYWKNPKGMSVR